MGRDNVINIATEYFDNIYTTSNPDMIEDVLSRLETKATDAMNFRLAKAVSNKEVEDAVFSNNPCKTPRRDGLTGKFIQANLSLIKRDICTVVKKFFC